MSKCQHYTRQCRIDTHTLYVHHCVANLNKRPPIEIVMMSGICWGSALGEKIGGHPGGICGAIWGLIFPICFYLLITSTIGGFIGCSFEKLLFKIINLFRRGHCQKNESHRITQND